MGMTLVIAATVAVWLLVVCVAWFPRRRAEPQEPSPYQEAKLAQGTAAHQARGARQDHDRPKITAAEDVPGEADGGYVGSPPASRRSSADRAARAAV